MANQPQFQQQLRTDVINWRNLLTHPSEFTRIDEQLRLKQLDLAKFNERMEGWTKIAAQENLEHQRLVYSMRCYLSITCNKLFGVSMLSTGEYTSLKESFVDTENILSETDPRYVTLNEITHNEYWLLLHLASDRYQTEQLYRKVIGKIIESIDPTLDWNVRRQMIDTIVKKCFFTVE